jgi:hypothetical protein
MKWIFYLALDAGARAVASTTDEVTCAHWIKQLCNGRETGWLEMNSVDTPHRRQFVDTARVVTFEVMKTDEQ